MSVLVHVTLELRAEGAGRFMTAMAEIVPILEAEGWRLEGAFVQRTGRLNTVIDLWRLESMDHFDRALNAFRAHPRFDALKAELDANVLTETIVFAQDALYARA